MKNYDQPLHQRPMGQGPSGNVFEVHDSTTEEVFATVPQGTRS
jgi:hypothetical protein